jgi:hypothetical protein
MLRAAWQPGELDPNVHELILAQALEDPLAEPDEHELAESQRLRDALAGGPAHPDANLARALGSAHAPSDLDEAGADKLARRAKPKSNVFFVAFGVAAGAAALAAGAALLLSPLPDRNALEARSALSELSTSRSAAALFSERFEHGQATARIDRIYQAREKELRDNRFALWGVR